MLYLKLINFLRFHPRAQCLAERRTTTDGEQTCNFLRTGSCPGCERDSLFARNIPQNVAQQVNQELLSTYWKIGEVIVRCEQNDSVRAAYGEKTLLQLSKALTKELGKGFSRSNLQNMRLLYLNYPICQTMSGKLSGLSNQIFASRYVLYMPNKEQLIEQVEEVLKRWHSHEGE